MEYTPSVIYVNGIKVIYLLLVRSIYGFIKAAILWYNLYTRTLQSIGFELNPYDICVANKNINQKQCTIAWHFNDNKILSMEKYLLDEIIKQQENILVSLL